MYNWILYFFENDKGRRKNIEITDNRVNDKKVREFFYGVIHFLRI